MRKSVTYKTKFSAVLFFLSLTFLFSAAHARDFEAARPQAIKEVLRLIVTLSADRLEKLGLSKVEPSQIALSPPITVYTIDKDNLINNSDRAWGGMFRKTKRAFFPIRIKKVEKSGIWIVRSKKNFTILGIGDAELAVALAQARHKIPNALSEMDLLDPYEVRLIELEWASLRFLAVLIRDRIMIWPLPSALKLMRLNPGLYRAEQIIPILTGRSAR